MSRIRPPLAALATLVVALVAAASLEATEPRHRVVAEGPRLLQMQRVPGDSVWRPDSIRLRDTTWSDTLRRQGRDSTYRDSTWRDSTSKPRPRPRPRPIPRPTRPPRTP